MPKNYFLNFEFTFAIEQFFTVQFHGDAKTLDARFFSYTPSSIYIMYTYKYITELVEISII